MDPTPYIQSIWYELSVTLATHPLEKAVQPLSLYMRCTTVQTSHGTPCGRGFWQLVTILSMGCVKAEQAPPKKPQLKSSMGVSWCWPFLVPTYSSEVETSDPTWVVVVCCCCFHSLRKSMYFLISEHAPNRIPQSKDRLNMVGAKPSQSDRIP